MEALTYAEWVAKIMGYGRMALVVTEDMASYAFYSSSIRQICRTRVYQAKNMEQFLDRLAGVHIVCVTAGNQNMDSLEIFQALRGNPNTENIPFVLVGKVSSFGVPVDHDQQWKEEMRRINLLHPAPANRPVYVPFGPQSIVGEIVAELVGWDWTTGEIDTIGYTVMVYERRALVVTEDMASCVFYSTSINLMCRVEVRRAENMEQFLDRFAGVHIVCVTAGNQNMDSLEIFQALRGNPNTENIPFVLVGKVSSFGVPVDHQQWKEEMKRINLLHPAPAGRPVYVPFGPQSNIAEIVEGLVGWD